MGSLKNECKWAKKLDYLKNWGFLKIHLYLFLPFNLIY